MRFAAILDGTIGTAAQQAQALGGFLREGLSGDLAGETLVFYHDERDKTGLVEMAPTRDVRLIKTTARRPGRMVEILTAAARGGISLFLFAGGSAGTELATRLACRTSGAVLTDALSIEVGPERLLCRKNVYSNHMVGRFELSARPWCASIDASWNDGRSLTSLEHHVLSDTDETGGTGTAPFEDLELVDPPSTGDLAESRFLVVAGNGAGSREGVERIAKAARRMGAAFGVSRPVAMNAWAPMDRLIGVSGTRAAPALCIVVGASGAPAFIGASRRRRSSWRSTWTSRPRSSRTRTRRSSTTAWPSSRSWRRSSPRHAEDKRPHLPALLPTAGEKSLSEEKIRDREHHRHHHSLTLDPPYLASFDTRPKTSHDMTLVRVTTDEGVTGIGAGYAMRGFEGHEGLFIGEDPLALERHYRSSTTSTSLRPPVATDIALWDLAGKITGQPVWKMLGGLSTAAAPTPPPAHCAPSMRP